jgi:hypothetical protein
MSNEHDAAQTPETVLKFRQMNGSQKIVHLLKVAVFLATFGFAFPNIFEDF